MPAPQVKQWESEGRYLKTVLFQHKVFCKEVGDSAAPPDRTLLLLHGYSRLIMRIWGSGINACALRSADTDAPSGGCPWPHVGWIGTRAAPPSFAAERLSPSARERVHRKDNLKLHSEVQTQLRSRSNAQFQS
jgi:hypothetical protein